MITFTLNNEIKTFSGNPETTLLNYLRNIEEIKTVKDGCSGQAFCGACMVEINYKPALSCVTKMGSLEGAFIVTLDSFPEQLKNTLAKAFVEKGAVQCGFCTPGFLTRVKILFDKNKNPNREEIINALRFNFCRCTGYLKIIEAVELAAAALNENQDIIFPKAENIGTPLPKYDALEKALGKSPFVDDLSFEGMVFGTLKMSDYPRAIVKKIDISEAVQMPGVLRVFTASDIPGNRFGGLIVKDWPLMVAENEETRYIGDILAGVVADDEETARKAAQKIKVDYEVLEPLTDYTKAEESSIILGKGTNILETSIIKRGENIDEVLAKSDFVVTETFETQRIEHAFLETECAVVLPEDDGIRLYSQSQGVYEDRKQIADILNLQELKIKVTLVSSGGAFGGKEDMTVQGHAALFAWLLKKPVKVKLNREESLRMHPKRHPMKLQYSLGCNKDGLLTGLKARIIGDTGAYASVGGKVLERAAGHAASAYHVPNADIEAKALYTNNIPSGAMRGFGVNQAAFAMESCIDMLCEKGGFDRWKFRFDNALDEGKMTTTGQIVDKSAGVKECLLALKDYFYKSKHAGIACAIKNCGIGNGMIDFSEVKIEIISENHIKLHHGWTEMGQGVFTVARQVFASETGINPDFVEVIVSTENESRSGMTTSSRGTSLLGNAIIEATKELKKDLKTKSLKELIGKTYFGRWEFKDSTKPGAETEKIITHYSYGYAAQLVVLKDSGEIDMIFAAHDAGKIINPTLFESQIIGSVHMGLGYALSENLEMEKGFLKSTKMKDLGIVPIKEMPIVSVIGIEVPDTFGPYGAKGLGEIGLVPTAAAVANAYSIFDKKRYTKLPLNRKKGH